MSQLQNHCGVSSLRQSPCRLFLWISPFHWSLSPCPELCAGTAENAGRLRLRRGYSSSQGARSSQGWQAAYGRCRAAVCSCGVLEILFGAILLFLVGRALCSLAHCFNSHQEIGPCSRSAMPLVPACGRPGGKCTGLFQGRSSVIRIAATLSPFVAHPVCLGRGRGGGKRHSNESVFLHNNSKSIYFSVQRKMLKSRSQLSTVPCGALLSDGNRMRAMCIILNFPVATLKETKRNRLN